MNVRPANDGIRQESFDLLQNFKTFINYDSHNGISLKYTIFEFIALLRKMIEIC